MFKEIFTEGKLDFSKLEKYIVSKKDNEIGKIILSVNFEDADEVDKIISKDKNLSKSLNTKDSTGKTKDYYFDV